MSQSFIIDFITIELGRGNLVIKEFVAVDDGGKVIRHVLFKPPSDFYAIESQSEKKIIREWQETTGLMWNYGYEDYSKLKEILSKLFPSGSTVYVKGAKKTIAIKKILDKNVCVRDLEDYDCPPIEVLHLFNSTDTCPFNHTVCALKDALCINLWWKEAQKIFNVVDAVGRSIKAVFNSRFSPPSPEELRMLPKDFLLNYEHNNIQTLYENLPRRLKNDEDIWNELPCADHPPGGEDVWDGPNPKRKFCLSCSRDKLDFKHM